MIRPLLAVACLALAACTPRPDTHPGQTTPAVDKPHQTATVEGRATYLERIAAPPGARLSVQLVDAQLADTPAAVIASQEFTDLSGPPYAFSLTYDPAKLRPNGQYGLHAGLRDAQGKLWFVTDTRVPVTLGTSSPVEFRMVRAGGDPVPPTGSPWDQAKARGVIFRGIGTEPGWLVEVGAGPSPPLHAELDYGERKVEVARLDRMPDGYRGKTADQTAVSLTTLREPCSDGMSDTEYPASMTLVVGEQTYRGCGRFLNE